ncbi:hypothetical protein FBUS_03281 [Fasciolopsis buskii]|uniref:Uncharacterized protein n=1 Tax=Fasciolopsis buskii TaxID=27845 RepID=A0A8E0S873_9TREM|nr:hypothetical protein FBUS_03281 [Fasciolopsis buski]
MTDHDIRNLPGEESPTSTAAIRLGWFIVTAHQNSGESNFWTLHAIKLLQRITQLLTICKAHLNHTCLCGHAGSVRTLWLDTKWQLLLSGSYDTSIRLWDLTQPNIKSSRVSELTRTGAREISRDRNAARCVRIYQGHTASVLCLWLDKFMWPRMKAITPRPTQSTLRLRPSLSPTHRLGNYTLRFITGGADCLCCGKQKSCVNHDRLSCLIRIMTNEYGFRIPGLENQ